MGVLHYMVDRETRRAYELGKRRAVPIDAYERLGHVAPEIVADSAGLPWDTEPGWTLVGTVYEDDPGPLPRPLPDDDRGEDAATTPREPSTP